MQIATTGLGAILAWLVLLVCVVLVLFIVLLGADIAALPLILLALIGVVALSRLT